MTDYPIGVQPLKMPKKPYKGQAHTPKSAKGLGDYYGTGIPAKIGKMRDQSMGMQVLTFRQMKESPSSVV